MADWRLHKTKGVMVFFGQLTPVLPHGLSQGPSSVHPLGGSVFGRVDTYRRTMDTVPQILPRCQAHPLREPQTHANLYRHAVSAYHRSIRRIYPPMVQ